MLQEGLFSFSEKNGWFSSNAIANMAYFVFIHAYVCTLSLRIARGRYPAAYRNAFFSW